ncbi:MAG: epimerase [Candidatus Altiarchaeales archaeon ex4484_96]|nr:MAG: epimerase [Candidatus Altiarchaeales archaeon ex4484_96]
MRVLVTGGCGFIGLNLIEYLSEVSDFKVRVLDRSDERKRYLNPEVEFIKGDIRDGPTVKKALSGCDYVVNLAAETGVIPSINNPLRDADVNVLGTLNLLFHSRDSINGFIHASSAAPLGEHKPPLHEGLVPRPLSPYGAGKLAGEGYCFAFNASYGLKTICLRFSNVYGPYSMHKMSAVHLFIRKALKGEPVTVYGDGKQSRDLVYVGDICQAIHKSISGDITGLYHVGTGKQTSLLELLDLIEELTGKKIKIDFKPERKGEIKINFCSIDKARSEMDYNPMFSLREGLEQTIRWYREHKI